MPERAIGQMKARDSRHSKRKPFKQQVEECADRSRGKDDWTKEGAVGIFPAPGLRFDPHTRKGGLRCILAPVSKLALAASEGGS